MATDYLVRQTPGEVLCRCVSQLLSQMFAASSWVAQHLSPPLVPSASVCTTQTSSRFFLRPPDFF